VELKIYIILGSVALHHVGILGDFLKKVAKKFPTHVDPNFEFFSQDFFGKVKNGQKKCPNFKNGNTFPKIFQFSLHNENLSS